MKNYLLIVFLITSFVSTAQKLSITDSIDLYNGMSVSNGLDTIKLAESDYERALELSQRMQYKIGEFYALKNLGLQAIDEGFTEVSLKHFQQAYSIAEILDDPNKKSLALLGEGKVYYTIGNYELALNYFKESMNLIIQEVDTLNFGNTFVDIASAYIKLEKGDSAMIFLNRALDIFEAYDQQEGVVAVLNNMGIYYGQKGQLENAIQYFKRMIENDIIDSDLIAKSNAYANIASTYGYLKDHLKAEYYYFKALEIDQENDFRNKEYQVYQGLSYLYSDIGDYKKAYEFQQKHFLLKDSILGAENETRIAEMQLQYDVVSKEKALLESKEKILLLEQAQKTSRFRTTITVLSLIALLMFGIYLIGRLRQKKQQLIKENQLIASDLEEFREKLTLVEGELETKTQDLTDFALDIARKNEIAAQLVSALKKVEKHLKNKTNEDFVALKSLVNSHQQINEDISFFQENIDTINNDFFNSLKTAYPSLTKNELQLCALIRLGLSIKDIAAMRMVEPKSIEMSRYRIRKKFELDKGKDLNDFLLDISSAN